MLLVPTRDASYIALRVLRGASPTRCVARGPTTWPRNMLVDFPTAISCTAPVLYKTGTPQVQGPSWMHKNRGSPRGRRCIRFEIPTGTRNLEPGSLGLALRSHAHPPLTPLLSSGPRTLVSLDGPPSLTALTQRTGESGSVCTGVPSLTLPA